VGLAGGTVFNRDKGETFQRLTMEREAEAFNQRIKREEKADG
jgi:hypothetical protein